MRQPSRRPPRTRERILRLLLAGEHTVESLAGRLSITENAVRSQLQLLEREGLAEVRGEVRGTRRPAALYALRQGAEAQFSRAYPLAFSLLVRVLSQRLGPGEFERTMRELGRTMAAGGPRANGSPLERVEAARRLLRDLGSETILSERDRRLVISGDSCPIGEAVAADGRSCISMAAMIEELTGLQVTERCQRGDRPRCQFEISLEAGRRPRKPATAVR